MAHLFAEDLYSLEEYEKIRPNFRAKVIEHKKNRRLPIGPNAALYFEDQMTIQYQIQEMLRIEKIFQADAIQDELDAYNPLIPDGANWKVTFMIEYPDENERRYMLSKLIGIEKKTWLRVEGFDKIYPITNEDLERETEYKTSSIHFMRFELTSKMAMAIKAGAGLGAGIEHENYDHCVDQVETNLRDSLARDLG